MRKLILLAALLPTISPAQGDSLTKLVNAANQLELYGESATRCNYAIQALGRTALESNNDCAMLLSQREAVQQLMQTALAHMNAIDHAALREPGQREYSGAALKLVPAMEEFVAFLRRVEFLSR